MYYSNKTEQIKQNTESKYTIDLLIYLNFVYVYEHTKLHILKFEYKRSLVQTMQQYDHKKQDQNF